MNKGKVKSLLKIVIKNVIENTVEKSPILKAIHEMYEECRKSDKEFPDWIEGKSGINYTALHKNLIETDTLENIEYVVAEIKKPVCQINNNIFLQCQYKYEKIYDFLWKEYLKDKPGGSEIEYEGDIKFTLCIIAKCLTEAELAEKGFTEKLLVEIFASIEGMREEINSNFADLDAKEASRFAGLDEKEASRFADSNAQIVSRIDKLEVEIKESINDVITQTKRNDNRQTVYDEESKEIKIYLAASCNECGEYIAVLKSFIEQLNTEYLQDDTHITLFCGSNEQRNEERDIIQKCNYYYVLVKTMAENWMQESYEFAYSQYRDTEFPVISIFFKELSKAELKQAHKSLKKFKDKYIEDFGAAPITFENIDTVKLHIMMHNLDLIKSGSIIPQLEENCIKVNDNIRFSLNSIPQFQTNEALCRARKNLDALQAEYDAACNIYYRNSNPETRRKLEQVKEKLETQRKTVSRLIKDIWDNMIMMADKSRNRKEMDIREIEALDCIDKHNDYEGAKLKLEDSVWKEETTIRNHLMKIKKEEEGRAILQYISGQRLLISILKTKGIDTDSENKIIQIYKYITGLSQEWKTEYNTLYEYAEFLLVQRRYGDGLAVCEKLKCLYMLDDNILMENKARMFNLLGQLYYWNKKYEKAEENYERAVQILKDLTPKYQGLILEINFELARLFWKTNQFQKADKKFRNVMKKLDLLVQNDAEIYDKMRADTYNYLAILAHKRKQLDEALKYHHKSLEIRAKLAGKHPLDEKGEVLELSNTYNNLGVIYKKLGDYETSIHYHDEALNIRRENVMKNPSVYRPTVALACTNLAAVSNLNGENKRAQELCQEALDIRRELASENSFYKVEVAKTLCEFGIILGYASNYPQAEECFQEAVKINKELVKENEMAHKPTLAEAYLNYGRLLTKKGKEKDRQWDEEAEKYFKKALKIFNKFEKDNPSYYVFEIAESCDELTALLCQYPQKRSQAEAFCREAVKYWEILAEKCMRAYSPRLEAAKNSLIKLAGNNLYIN